jgi:PAS domain S-box-containing protein
MYGYTKPEFLGKTVADLVPEDLAPQLPEILRRERAEGGFFIVTRNKRRDGTIFPCAVSTRPLEYGGRSFLVVFIRDLSEQARVGEP